MNITKTMKIKKDYKMNDNSTKTKAVRLWTVRKWKGFAGDMKRLRKATSQKTNADALKKITENLREAK